MGGHDCHLVPLPFSTCSSLKPDHHQRKGVKKGVTGVVLRKLNQITELMTMTKRGTKKQTMLHAGVFHLDLAKTFSIEKIPRFMAKFKTKNKFFV